MVDNSDKMNGIFMSNINQFLVAATILNICNFIKRDFPLTRLRILPFEFKLIKCMKILLNNVYQPVKTRLLLKQKDHRGHDTLALIAMLRIYEPL